ncbi:toxin HigB-2 [Actinobacillus lignieresii]|uniref:type II toxin-antitoxin system RelE/ParE family toxin n=1 Tax=Actinobacillus lignieresii TaxID=720 RepID=UPI000E13BB4E|nr:type II toxin-antitoxin system RelE/ParE family toxin [Actinobacillus lignieresii]SUT99918.1 toxin HigB-2 [Actinobacillus lignieresii]
MKLVFVELPPFNKFRYENLTDDDYREFQEYLMNNPEAGDIVQGINGLRKIRISTQSRGKKGGARVIYYYYVRGSQIWLFTGYNKSRKIDLNSMERKAFSKVLEHLKNIADREL